jgi:hypothetical protein
MELETRQPDPLKCCAKEKEFLTIFKKNNFFDPQILQMKNKGSSLRALSKFLKDRHFGSWAVDRHQKNKKPLQSKWFY